MLISWMLGMMRVCTHRSSMAELSKKSTSSSRLVAAAHSSTTTTTGGWTFSFCRARVLRAHPKAPPIVFTRTIVMALSRTLQKKQDCTQLVGLVAFAWLTITTTALTTFSAPASGRTFSTAITAMAPSRMSPRRPASGARSSAGAPVAALWTTIATGTWTFSSPTMCDFPLSRRRSLGKTTTASG